MPRRSGTTTARRWSRRAVVQTVRGDVPGYGSVDDRAVGGRALLRGAGRLPLGTDLFEFLLEAVRDAELAGVVGAQRIRVVVGGIGFRGLARLAVGDRIRRIGIGPASRGLLWGPDVRLDDRIDRLHRARGFGGR